MNYLAHLYLSGPADLSLLSLSQGEGRYISDFNESSLPIKVILPSLPLKCVYTEVNQVLENPNHDYFGITETNQLCFRKPELFQYNLRSDHMNYLAHIFLSGPDPEIMTGNFIGIPDLSFLFLSEGEERYIIVLNKCNLQSNIFSRRRLFQLFFQTLN